MSDELKVKVGVEVDLKGMEKLDAAIKKLNDNPVKIKFDNVSFKAFTDQFKNAETQIESFQRKCSSLFSKINSDAAKSINNSNLTKQNSTWLTRQEKALEKVNLGANSAPVISGKENQLAKINQEYSKSIALINECKNSTSALSAVQMAQVETAVSGLQKQYKAYQDLGQMSDKQVKRLLEEFDSGKLGNSLTKISGQGNSLGSSATSETLKALDQLKAQYSEIAASRKKMQDSGAGEDAGMQQSLAKQISLYKELTKTVQSYVDVDKAKKRDADTTQVEVGRLQKLSNELRNYLEINDRALTNRGIKNSSTDLLNDINSLVAAEKVTSVQTDELSSKFAALKGHVKDLGLEGQTLGTKLTSQMSKLGIYFSAATVMMGAWSQVKNTIGNVTELDKAVTDLQIATGKTRDETKELLNTYSDMGKQLGANTGDVAKSADSWLRQGFSVEESNTLIKNSMMLSKLGQIDSAESTKALTSAMKGYGVSVADSISIVDKFTSVDMAAAVSAGDIAKAMAETATSARLAGVDIDRLTGYIATVAEVTQDGAESVGTFYRTLFARMGNVKEGKLFDPVNSEDLSSVETVLSGLGIKLRSSGGEFRNFGEVLDEVAAKWDSYGTVNQRAIAVAFSGYRVA